MKDKVVSASMLDVVRRIGIMNEKELSETVLCVMERYRELFVQEEIVFLSLPKDDLIERRRILERVCGFAEMISE